MMAFNEQQISIIVERVVAILRQREQAIYTISFAALPMSLDANIWIRYSHLVVTDIDACSLHSLLPSTNQPSEIKQLLQLVSYGMHVSLAIPPSLCSQLPVSALLALPFHWQTSTGQRIYLCQRAVVAYADVCQLSNAILITKPKAIVTAMAREAMQKNSLACTHSEDSLWI